MFGVKNQTQAGSPEVRVFSTSCRLQQLFHHLRSPVGSGKLSDPHQLVMLEKGSEVLARPLIRTPISSLDRARRLEIRLLKLAVNIQGWENLKVLLISKKYVSSNQSQQPFYLLHAVTNLGFPPSSSASVWPLFYVSKAGIFCLTVLKNELLKHSSIQKAEIKSAAFSGVLHLSSHTTSI